MRGCLHIGGHRSLPRGGCSDGQWALPEAKLCRGWPKLSSLLGGQLCQRDIKVKVSLLGPRKAPHRAVGCLMYHHLQGQAMAQPWDCTSHPHGPVPGTPSSCQAAGTKLRAERRTRGGIFLSAGTVGSEGLKEHRQLPQGCSGHQRQMKSQADLGVSHHGQPTLWPPEQTHMKAMKRV